MSDEESEERFRFLVEHAPDGVVILVGGVISYINPRAIELLGADPATVLGSSILTYLPPEDARATMQRIGAMFQTGKDMPPNDYRVLADDKRVVEIKSKLCDWDGQRGVIAYARDVTERKLMQDKLVAADRFTALGKLAAGVAHEINNPLTYAQASLELIGRRLRELAITELADELADAHHGLDRIAAVTKDLRTFARPDSTPASAVELFAAIEQSLRMVDNELRHRARLVRRYAGGVPRVLGTATRLEQVFVNLLINAVHSLTRPETDQIVVATRVDGERVVVEITDTGTGIPEDVIGRVFDPFFTTKAVGVGMGLGLSVCKNLIERDGGDIAIASSPTGTTVTLRLPIAPLDAPRTMESTPLAAPVDGDPRRRVLIVDDEPFIRETLAVLLSSHHDVTTADGGPSALVELGTGKIDVVLCDVMMPGMNGVELYRRTAAEHAGLERRFVFVTGGAFAPDLVAFLGEAGNPCLAKPFKLDQILAAIREVTH